MAPKGKQKAQSAAQAASKKKSSAVEISHAAEQSIRQALKVGGGGTRQQAVLGDCTTVCDSRPNRPVACPSCQQNPLPWGSPRPVQDLDVPWQEAEAPPSAADAGAAAAAAAAAPVGGLPSEESLLEVYASLQRQGFQAEQVEAALFALPLPAVTLETALDWLLLHLEASQLPKRYAAQGRAGAGGAVDVKHRAREAAPADAAATEQQQAAEAAAAEAARRAAEEARRAEERRAAEEAKRAEAQRAKEEEQRRSWILQYAQVPPLATSAARCVAPLGGVDGACKAGVLE